MAAVSHAAPGPSVFERALIAAVTASGWVSGRVLRVLPSVPGLAGAGAVSLGTGMICGHVFGHGLAPWVTILAAGGFGLLRDRRQ